jgi:hypothetical protein
MAATSGRMRSRIRTSVNFLTDEGEDRVRESYRGNYDRLVTIKNKYDPRNMFRNKQNIKPSS